MKNAILLLGFLSLIFLRWPAVSGSPAISPSGFTYHSGAIFPETAQADEITEEEDFSPGLFIFILILFGSILFSVGAGIVLTLAVLMTVFALVSFGVLSGSVIVGLYKKSVASGFRFMVISVSAIGGLLSGGTIFWGINKIVHQASDSTAFLAGTGAGLVAGIALGWLVLYTLKKLTHYLKLRLRLG